MEGKLKDVVTVRGIFHRYGKDYDNLVGFCENMVKDRNRDFVIHLDLLGFDGGPLERALEQINRYCKERGVRFYTTCPKDRKEDYEDLNLYSINGSVRLIEDSTKVHEHIDTTNQSSRLYSS